MLLLAKYKDVTLSGRLDSVIFQNGYPMVVFEYKFIKSRIAYMTHHAQARTYGILLRDMGFDERALLIVASDLDDQGERVIRYLSQYEISVNAVTFNYFRKDDREYIARVLLIPKSAEETRKPKRRYKLSEEELKNIAEDNGVGESYYIRVHGLTPLFDREGTTLSSIAFSGLQEGKMNTIFSIIPSQSSQESGLKFQIYLKRFAKYFNMAETDSEKMLPTNRKEWSFDKSANPEYSGHEGFFKEKEEIKIFLNKLQELRSKH